MKLEFKMLGYYLILLFVIVAIFALLIENVWNPIKRSWSNVKNGMALNRTGTFTENEASRNIAVTKNQQILNGRAQVLQTKKKEKEIEKLQTMNHSSNQFGKKLGQHPIDESRKLREEQDKEFLESLRIDEEKEAKMQRKIEKRKKKMNKKLTTELAPLPPIEQNEGVCTIGIRFPNGKRIERRFYTTEKLQSVIDFC